MKLLSTLIIISSSLISFTQGNVYLSFKPKCTGNDLVLGATVQDLNGSSMKIDHFNYYISNIHIIYDGGQDMDFSDTILLVKADAHTFLLDNLNISNVEQINFSVGVPEAINHLDITQYPIGHFLSFQTPSMHWGWTSGYKLLLIDGYGDSNGDGIPENLFQLHNLGDNNFKNIQLPIVATYGNDSQLDIVVNCNLDEWIYGTYPGTIGVNHGSSGVNESTMNNVNNRRVFTAPSNASINDVSDVGEIYFVNQLDGVRVTWKEMSSIHSYEMIDVSGKTIAKSKDSNVNQTVLINNVSSGSYIFTTFNKAGKILNTINLVR
jgi:hypothetical protein